MNKKACQFYRGKWKGDLQAWKNVFTRLYLEKDS